MNVKDEFKKKYNFHQIKSVSTYYVDSTDTNILEVYTSDPRIWVDLPEKFQGYYVNMRVINY